MSDVVDPQFISLGVGGLLLVFVFKTLWRQEDGWQGVLAAARQDAADARADAALARKDAELARTAEAECRRRLDMLERRIRELEDRTPPDGHPNQGAN